MSFMEVSHTIFLNCFPKGFFAAPSTQLVFADTAVITSENASRSIIYTLY